MQLGKKKSLVGLDIGTSEVKAIELTQVGDHLKITGFGHAPVESKDAVKDTIADVFRRSGIRTKRVATAVSGRAVIVRYINMTKMSDEELKSALRFEADKYIPFQVEEVVLDCVRLPDFGESTTPEAEKEMKVLLVAVKQTLIDEHLLILQGLGLIPTVIDVDTFALGNAFELNSLHSPRVEDEEKVIALVDVGSVKTNINILKNNTSYFSREVYLAGNDFTEAVSRRLGTDMAEAEKLKLNPQGKEDAIEESILPTLDDLGNEIHLSFDYYENQYDREVDEVYISGGSAKIPGVKACFERVFDRRIHFWDPTENLEVNTDRVDVQDMKDHGAQVAVAVGLASRIIAK
ncbi:MAG TPA: type IV pilus assembly protein PilM [Planctomycetota bacterium]|nr:type IV pilus assembly protein PilM [Planctomycetota bacterium]